MAFGQLFENSLRILEPKFESGKLPLPEISPIIVRSTKYDAHMGKLLMGTEQEAGDCSALLKTCFIGKAASSYIHHSVNREILRLLSGSMQKFKDAQKHGFEAYWLKSNKREYELLFHLCTLVSTYGGLVFVETQHDKAKAEELSRSFYAQVSNSVIGSIIFENKGILPFGSLEATLWYAKGNQWLSRLARLTTKKGYEVIAREAGLDSALLQ